MSQGTLKIGAERQYVLESSIKWLFLGLNSNIVGQDIDNDLITLLFLLFYLVNPYYVRLKIEMTKK